jgi:hypothetical protein
MTSSATGTLSNVSVSSSVSKRTTTYSVDMTVTYTSNGHPVTQPLHSSNNRYHNGQTVDLLIDPATGVVALKSEYVSPAQGAKWAMAGACLCILCSILGFVIVSTTWGCGIVAFQDVTGALFRNNS